MRILVVLLILAVAAAGSGLGFIFSGLADVGATSPHWAITEWLLSTTLEPSVRSRAKDIQPLGLFEEEAPVRQLPRMVRALPARE